MNRLPENSDMAPLGTNASVKEHQTDPEQIEKMKKMGIKVHLTLRMAAMNMLERAQEGYTLRLDGKTMHYPQAKTLFDAFLAIDEENSGDWNNLDCMLQAPWTKEAIRMVLDPWKYTEVWRALRMTLITEALPMLKQYANDEETKEASKMFTLIGLHVCDQVMNTLARSEEKEN